MLRLYGSQNPAENNEQTKSPWPEHHHYLSWQREIETDKVVKERKNNSKRERNQPNHICVSHSASIIRAVVTESHHVTFACFFTCSETFLKFGPQSVQVSSDLNIMLGKTDF